MRHKAYLACVLVGLLAAHVWAEQEVVLSEDFERPGPRIEAGTGTGGTRGFKASDGYGVGSLYTKKGISYGRYKLIFQAKSPGGKGSVGFAMYEHEGQGRITDQLRPKGFWGIALTDEWKTYELDFRTSWPDADSLRIDIYRMGQQATIQLDNVKVVLVEPIPFKPVPPGRRVEMLKNRGFEEGKKNWSFSFSHGTGSTWEVLEDPKGAHLGSHYSVIHSKDALCTYLSQKTSGLLHPGVTYRIGAWVKGDGRILVPGGRKRFLNDQWAYIEWTHSVESPAVGKIGLSSREKNKVLCYDDLTIHADKADGAHLTDPALPQMRSLDGPETPHVKWANPLRGGGLKVLFVLPKNQAREAIEVAQRLELTSYDVVPMYMGVGPAAFGIYMHEPQATLLRSFLKKKHYDCIVLGHTPCWQVPPDVQNLLIQKAEAGTGLIWSKYLLYKPEYFTKQGHGYKPEALEYFIKGARHIKLDALEVKTPRMGALARPKVRDVKRGRFAYVHSGYWGLTEAQARACETSRYWEYQFLAWAKLIRWASGRDPEVRLASIEYEDGEFLLKLKNTTNRDQTVRVSTRVVDRFEQTVASVSKEATLSKLASSAPSSVDLRLRTDGPLPAGMHFVQVIVHDKKGRVHDFGALEINVPGQVVIASAKPLRQRFDPGGTVELAITLENKRRGAARVTLAAALQDAHGRRVTRHSRALALEPGSTKIRLSLEPRDIRTVLAYAPLILREGDRVLHEERTRVYLQQPRTFDDFMPAAYYGWVYGTPTYLLHLAMPVLRDIGIRVVMGSRDPETEAGLRVCSQSVGVARDKDGHGNNIGDWNDKLERGFCLHDPEDLAHAQKQIRKTVVEGQYGKESAWRKYTPIWYGMWDEPGIIYASSRANVDLCWNPLTLEALRRDLKRIYGSLEALNAEWETNFTSWESVVPMKTDEVRGRKNIAPWMDFRMFMTREFARYAGRVQSIIRNADGDPNAPCSVNIHGVTPYCCTTHYHFARHLSMVQTYGHSLEANRSFYQVRGVDPGILCLWTGYNYGAARCRYDCWGVAAHGGTMPAYFIEPAQNLIVTPAEIDSALSAGLGISELGGALQTAFRDLVSGLGKALRTAEIQMPEVAKAVSYEQAYRYHGLQEGGTGGIFGDPLQAHQTRSNMVTWQQIENDELKKYKVLVGVPAFVSDKALRKIVEFLDGGGVLVGRVEAQHDEHGKPRTDRTLVGAVVAKALKVDGKDATEEALRKAAVHRGLRLSLPREAPAKLNGFLVTEFRRGPVRYFVVLRSCSRGKELGNRFEAHFAGKGIIYEARSHRCYGGAKKVEFELEPSYAKVFAVLPYEIESVAVRAEKRAERGHYMDYAVEFRPAGGAELGDHAVHVEVLQPAGRSVYALQRNLLAEKGRVRGRFMVAFNDAPGNWTIRATDPISGKSAEHQFTVR